MGLRLGILAALLLSWTAPAQAARFSGDYLLQMCLSDKNGKELVPGGHVACQSYIAGVLDYHNLIRSLGTSPSVEFCVPENVGLNQLQKDVASYLYKNKSQHGAFIAAPAVALALFNAYPCGKKKK
ncbi:MAG: hypothetical protein DYH13_10140 [Alphaproteobacteria bacterium PRO2]|nr:hypothetical protein [Alphaproteobacteria bacterium PRO2]